jgi:UDP:flavonoid glycosyltransferase YjiC (YdhE family)
MRYLFITLDGGGNLYPELALAGRLAERGHDISFLGSRSQRAIVGREGFAFAAWRSAPDFDASASETALVKDWSDDPETVFADLCDHTWFGPAGRFTRDVAAEAHGVPMLCLPMGRDQDGNAARVERLGLGRVLRADSGAADIAAAVRGALTDPVLRRNAVHQADRIRAGIAADRAVAELEALGRHQSISR